MSCVGNKLTSVGLLTRHFNLACRDDFGLICTNYVSRLNMLIGLRFDWPLFSKHTIEGFDPGSE